VGKDQLWSRKVDFFFTPLYSETIMDIAARLRFRHLLLLIAFFAHLLVGAGHAQGFAWCLGSDGEMRLEHNPQGSCDIIDPCAEESGEGNHAEHGPGNLDADHCNDCLDFPSVSQDSHHASRFLPDADLASFTPAALSSTHFSSFLPLLEAIPGFRPQPPPPQQPTLAFLRTVVLRN
jgi:hypothetical protein